MKLAHLVTLAGLALATSASAVTTLPSVTVTAAAPKPAVVVNPINLPLEFTGATVKVEFKLDANGRPRDARLMFVDDARLRKSVLKAFNQWQFAHVPADAEMPGKSFVLPIDIRVVER